MAREIERKFLVAKDTWRSKVIQTKAFAQGYLNDDLRKSSIRVRIEGDQAKLNIKSVELGLSRDEYELDLPKHQAQEILEKFSVTPVLSKIRHWIPQGDLHWEVDEFLGENAPLIVAEIELPDEQTPLILPDWVGEEVTHDPRYFNVYLVNNPYSTWSTP